MHKPSANTRNPSGWHVVRLLCFASVCLAFSSHDGSAQPAIKPPIQKPSRTYLKKNNALRARHTVSHQSESSALPTSADIVLKNGILSIHANNADMDDILGRVAKASGMLIRGSARGISVYGVYGPEEPENVLTELLAGSGINVMMVGRTLTGAPRELLLTPRTGSASPPTIAAPPSPSDAGVPDTSTPDTPGLLGPGAIPSGPPPPSQDPEERQLQNLHRLQQMQDRQKTQNPPP